MGLDKDSITAADLGIDFDAFNSREIIRAVCDRVLKNRDMFSEAFVDWKKLYNLLDWMENFHVPDGEHGQLYRNNFESVTRKIYFAIDASIACLVPEAVANYDAMMSMMLSKLQQATTILEYARELSRP